MGEQKEFDLMKPKGIGIMGEADKRSRIVCVILQELGKGELRNDQQCHYFKVGKARGPWRMTDFFLWTPVDSVVS